MFIHLGFQILGDSNLNQDTIPASIGLPVDDGLQTKNSAPPYLEQAQTTPPESNPAPNPDHETVRTPAIVRTFIEPEPEVYTPAYTPKGDASFFENTTDPKRTRSKLAGTLRALSESVACLIVAVAMLRMFIIEGYIISTGSMAPNLFGFHKQAQCPACQHRFAVGIAFDRDAPQHSQITSCPNCDQPGITLGDVPRNDGDQLLVFKNAYTFRDPRRWEIVVFMNPGDPTQAYVKRVAGLPDDQIQIINGDVFINGQREQKPIDIQRAMRIVVFDNSRPVRSKSWIPRWIVEQKWKSEGQAFVLGDDRDSFATDIGAPSESAVDEIPLDSQMTGLKSTASTAGLLSWASYMHWPRLGLRDRKAVVAGEANLSPRPITDRYGYNPREAQHQHVEVNDLMIDVRITLPLLSQFVTVLRSDQELVVCTIDRAQGLVESWVCADTSSELKKVLARNVEPFAVGKLPTEGLDEAIHLEVSAFDRQLIVAVNQISLITKSFESEIRSTFDSTDQSISDSDDSKATVGGQIETVSHMGSTFDRDRLNDRPPERNEQRDRSDSQAQRRSSVSPVRFGAIGAGVRVHSISVYRDVHYTARESQHAINTPVKLGSDEFFFLGDNSPVSLDSRGWRDPVVARRLIVGKPMVVHLPSRPAQLQVGSWVRHIRVPEFSRMRVIR
jgi:signal peptidase I